VCCREALLVATPEDIINIADILGVTFQDNCVATALKVQSQRFSWHERDVLTRLYGKKLERFLLFSGVGGWVFNLSS
jgi:hypothetical protein